MALSITVISDLSFFAFVKDIRSYHAAFFHGIANREGVWSPFETKGMDANTEFMPPLSIWSNQYYVPHYCVPGTWPVVSETIRHILADVPTVKFLPVHEERTVDFPWKIGEPIKIEPANLWRVQLFESLPEVEPTKLGKRYELVGYKHAKIIGSYDARKAVLIEVGSPPSPTVLEYKYCWEFLNDFPIHSTSTSMIFTDEYWIKIEPYIDKPFFNIRTYELESI